MLNCPTDLTSLFEPQSVAHVGASPNDTQGRFNFTKFLNDMNYQGNLYPINPKYNEILGFKCYKDLNDVQGTIDLTILAVPSEKCMNILRNVEKGKLRFVVIHTSGFREINKSYLEDELIDLKNRKGFRIIGPNCMGVFCQKHNIGFWEDHKAFSGRPGSIGLISQSGGIAINTMTGCIDAGIYINKAVSLGNQIDLSISELLAFMGEDDTIRVIAVYVEAVKDGRAFIDLLKHISIKKPVLIWKGGKTEIGKAAALSHTGSLAGNTKLFLSAVEQAGGILIDNFEQLFRALKILQSPYSQVGGNMAVISPGGGNTVNLSDAFSDNPHLFLPRLLEDTQNKLKDLLPEENVDIKNPVDPGAVGVTNIYNIVRIIGDDPQIDSLFVLISNEFIHHFKDEETRKGLSELIAGMIREISRELEKPIYIHVVNARENNEDFFHCRKLLIDQLNANKLPWTDGPFNETAVTFSRLAGYTRFLAGHRSFEYSSEIS